MKRLIFLGGTMGVGKSAAGACLNDLLPASVWLDGDWCWRASPFVVTEETKEMVAGNITHLLRSFLACSAYENVLFTWFLHEPQIADDLRARIRQEIPYRFYHFSLFCPPPVLEARLQGDIDAGLRTPDVLSRSLARLPLYPVTGTRPLDTGALTPFQTAEAIISALD